MREDKIGRGSGSAVESTALEKLSKRVEQLEVWCQKILEMLLANAQRLLDGVESLVNSNANSASVAENGRFFVECLMDGVHKSGWFSEEQSNTILLSHEFDVVAHEPSHLLKIRGHKDRKILPIRKMQRGMLFLVVTHVGRNLEQAEIGSLFGFDVEKLGNRRRVYQYRIELAKLLGLKLRDRIVLTGNDWAYEIPRTGWTFCWIRKQKDPWTSELRHRLPPGKPRENQ
jgi:hypothetical protein